MDANVCYICVRNTSRENREDPRCEQPIRTGRTCSSEPIRTACGDLATQQHSALLSRVQRVCQSGRAINKTRCRDDHCFLAHWFLLLFSNTGLCRPARGFRRFQAKLVCCMRDVRMISALFVAFKTMGMREKQAVEAFPWQYTDS